MRRLIQYVVILSLVFFSISCSTMDTAAVKEVDQAAVALVGVDKHLTYSDDFDAAQLVQRLAQSNKFDLKPVAKKLHKRTFGIYSESMPFELMSEKKVIKADRYKNFELFDSDLSEKNFKKGSNFITVKNYKAYRPTHMNKGHRAKLFEAMPDDAEAMLLVDLSYTLIQENSLIPGVNKGKVEASLNMELVKPSGERIININKKAESDNNMKVVLDAAILKPEKIRPLVMEATDKVMGKAEEFITGNFSG